MKAASKKGYNELKDGFNQARQWVSDKIAPGSTSTKAEIHLVIAQQPIITAKTMMTNNPEGNQTKCFIN